MIIKENIFFTPASAERMLHIYLPDDYDSPDTAQERYPVMYFFDGHNLFSDEDATYGKSWGLRSFLEKWYKKMIIVGIECSHVGNERLDEYSPYDGRLGDLQIHGTGKATMDWIVSSLKPSIDSRLRTYSFREATAIGGSSMGGLMALYAVSVYNDVFSKAACVSPSIGLVRGGRAGNPMLGALRDSVLDPDTRVYLSWGAKEDYHGFMSRNVLRAEELLKQKGVITMVFHQKDGGHCEADWERQVPGFMDFLW